MKRQSCIYRILSVFLAMLLLCAPILTGCAELGITEQDVWDVLDELERLDSEQTTDRTEQTTVPESDVTEHAPPAEEQKGTVQKDGVYTTKEDVAAYIRKFGHLPSNFVTKQEMQKLKDQGKNTDGLCVGGDHFGNYEGLLPEKEGRKWTECDIDTLHAKSRGVKRIVFSDDGLIYYTGDHYDSFELITD